MQKYYFSTGKHQQCLTIREFLKSANISARVIKDLTKKAGLILVNEKIAFINQKLNENDKIELTIEELEINEIKPIFKPLNIAYEDEHLLIVYKEKGIATIPSYCNNESSLANFVTFYMQQKAKDFVFRALNRLDKEAEGYVVIAKNKLIYSLIKNNIQKFYTLFCYGKVKEKFIDLPIETRKKDNGLNEIKRNINDCGKKSITEILENTYYEKLSISKCKVQIQTGRTHQIRLHFSHNGNFLLGDVLYGNKEIDEHLKINSLQLYCNELYFYHPFSNKTIHLIEQVKTPINLE